LAPRPPAGLEPRHAAVDPANGLFQEPR